MALASLDGCGIDRLAVGILESLAIAVVLLPHIGNHALCLSGVADNALFVAGDLLGRHPLASQRLTHGIGHRLWVIAIHVAAQEGGSAEHHINGTAVHRQGLFHPLDGVDHRPEAVFADRPAGE